MKHPTARVLDASAHYNRVASMELFARLMGYHSLRNARIAVSRWRADFPNLFPKRSFKYEKELSPVQLSMIWRNALTVSDAADECGYDSIPAFKMKISRLRSFYGEKHFPKKRGKEAVVETRQRAMQVKAASILWRSDAPTVDVAKSMGLSVSDLMKFINEHRRREGLSMFPYRGLVIQ